MKKTGGGPVVHKLKAGVLVNGKNTCYETPAKKNSKLSGSQAKKDSREADTMVSFKQEHSAGI